MKCMWWSKLIMRASQSAVMTWRSRHDGCTLQWWMLLFRIWWPSHIPVSPPIPIIRLNHGGGMCALTGPVVELHVYLRMPANVAGWSHLPRSPPPSLGGTKIILQRGTFAFTCIHAHKPLFDTKAKQLAWRSWTMLLATRAHTYTHSDSNFLKPSSLCITIKSVSPPLGCRCRVKSYF